MSQSVQAIVKTDTGKVEGYYKNALYIFKGVPYAAPPVGELRWLPGVKLLLGKEIQDGE